MAIDRGHGIATSSVLADAFDVDTLVKDSKAALAGAELAETNAEASETAAATSATAAASSATGSATSATASAASAASIVGDATAAAASATAAAASKTAAETAETNAETAETNAETAETNAETAETNAETAEAAALVSKNAAATSASSSANSASTSSTQAGISTTKAGEAATSATAAASSATAAASSATSAATSATAATTNGAAQVTLATAQVALATTQATNAASSATAGASSASTASTKATEAATSATGSATSATASAASATAAAATKDSIDEFYLGAQSSDPTVDNNGDAVTAGDWYFNTNSDTTRIYSGSAWQPTVISTAGFLEKAGGAMTGAITTNSTFDGRDVAADGVTADAALPKAGGTMTGNIDHNDGVRARYGTDNDLQIFHVNGSHSYIENVGEGDLIIQDADGDVRIKGKSNEDSIVANNDGSVQLYNDNVLQLETLATGASIGSTSSSQTHLDIITNTSSYGGVYFQDGADEAHRGAVQYKHGDDFMHMYTAGTERMRIHSNGVTSIPAGVALGVGTANTAQILGCTH